MTARDELRTACIETMALANHQAFDRLSETQKIRLRRTAAQYLDALHGIATVCPVEETEEMIKAGTGRFPSLSAVSSAAAQFRAMSAAGDLTNAPEKKP